ncbi:MAG: PQQ-binding-like beta-propeller repeat protein [Bacteroidota bacterium]
MRKVKVAIWEIKYFLQICCTMALGTALIGCKPKTQNSLITSFTTGGHTVYHLKPGTIKNQRMIVSAAYDGTVLCHDTKGELVWKTSTGEGFLFDLEVANIDSDSHEEVLVASSDGTLYAIDDDGTLMWQFSREAPLWQVHVVESKNAPIILTGGIERILFQLDENGAEIKRHVLNGAIRLINSGDIKGDGQTYLAVATTTHSTGGHFFLQLMDLQQFVPLWQKAMTNDAGSTRGRYFSLEVYDFDEDGKEEMVFGGQHNYPHQVFVYDSEGDLEIIEGDETHMSFNWQAIRPGFEWQDGEGIPQLPYEMNLIAYASSPKLKEDLVFNLYGRHLIVKDRQGVVLQDLVSPIAHTNLAFDEQTGCLLLSSELSGGDGVYSIQVFQEGWEQEFIIMKPVGKAVTLRQNMDRLLKQLENFEPPSYQPKQDKSMIILQQSPSEIAERYTKPYGFENVDFVSIYKYIERYEHGITDPLWLKRWESKHSSEVVSKEDILADAQRFEENGENFFLFGGHGARWGIDFYTSALTMTEVMKVAPRTFKGCVFAELEDTNDIMGKAVREELLPLAKEFHKYGKKILLRNKNIFWNGVVHLDIWKPAFEDPIYREVFVPSMEETNSRTQSLSLAGKTGLYLTNQVNHMSGRAVTDNATWNRSWEWGQTTYLSNMLRSLAIRRTYGADVLHVNIYSKNKMDLLPLYLLVDKGVLPCPKPADLLSVSEVAIGMTNPDADFIDRGTRGKKYSYYQLGEDPMVFDRLAHYWGGAPTPLHDFTRLAYNSTRRLTNFIPQLPYGMVTVIGEENKDENPHFKTVLKTDGKYWINNDGKNSPGSQLSNIKETLEAAAQKLPIRVKGDVSWSAIRLDETHIRVVLVDPGYFDPKERQAEVIMQKLDAIKCTDILAKEQLLIKDQRVAVSVPMGVLKVLDIEHSTSRNFDLR